MVSDTAGTLIAQSIVYYRNRADGSVETAYITPAKTPDGTVIAGSTNTFLTMSNTIRMAATTATTQTLAINARGLIIQPDNSIVFTSEDTSIVLPGTASLSVELSDISDIGSNSYGPFTITAPIADSVVAEIQRVRTKDSGQKIDFVIPTLVR